MQEHQIAVTRTARYFTLGNLDNALTEVWFVCHGQAQLARYFLKHFDLLESSTRLIVAPEALSRSYLDMQGSRIGATWMTREDRLNEIKDYINYLDMVYQQIFTSVSRTQVKVHALGFSQGVATVCRWLNAGNAHADRLILWAGQLPTELDTEGNWEIFQKLPTAIVIGNQDEFAEWSIVNHQAEILKKHHIDYQLITFEGTHKLDRNVLTRLAVS